MKRKVVWTSLIVAIVVIISAYILSNLTSSLNKKSIWPTSNEIGEPGSEHSHMSMLVFINGDLFDFSIPQYQLKSELVHFEDGEGITVHKHASGITLPHLFETLEMTLSSNCLTMASSSYCTNDSKTLLIYVNRVILNDKIASYELREGDKILIDYGNDDDLSIQLKLNSIPNLISDL